MEAHWGGVTEGKGLGTGPEVPDQRAEVAVPESGLDAAEELRRPPKASL